MADQNSDSLSEEERMAANLQKAFELTKLALELRLAAMRQDNPDCSMADVMHEIRLQKEAAWQGYAEDKAGRNLHSNS
jgi:hypothetical protein